MKPLQSLSILASSIFLFAACSETPPDLTVVYETEPVTPVVTTTTSPVTVDAQEETIAEGEKLNETKWADSDLTTSSMISEKNSMYGEGLMADEIRYRNSGSVKHWEAVPIDELDGLNYLPESVTWENAWSYME